VAHEGPPYSAPTKLCNFLNWLFGGSPENLPSKFPVAVKDARVNFNHFVNTDRPLIGERCETELLHRLLNSKSDLQLV
jgi:hypothetical protein